MLIEPQYRRGTVGDLLADLIVDYETHGRASLRTIRAHVAAVREAIGDLRAEEVTYDRLADRARDWQREGAANATVNRRFETLRRAYRLALRSDKVAQVPVFPRLDEHNARQGFFERGEFLALLADLPDDGLREFVERCYWTGMRKGEATALTWADFDCETWTLRLHAKHAKTRRGRMIVLRGSFREIIERRLAARRLDCPYVFWRPYDGKPTPNLQPGDAAPIQEFRKAWRTACKAAGLKGRLFHDLRRTGVRNLVRAGVSQHVAMQISGHRTDAVFRRYNITTETDLGSAAERVTGYVESLPTTPKVATLPEPNKHTSVLEPGVDRAKRRATA